MAIRAIARRRSLLARLAARAVSPLLHGHEAHIGEAVNGPSFRARRCAVLVGRRANSTTFVRYQVEGQRSRIVPEPGECVGSHGTHRIHKSSLRAGVLPLTQPRFLAPESALSSLTSWTCVARGVHQVSP